MKKTNKDKQTLKCPYLTLQVVQVENGHLIVHGITRLNLSRLANTQEKTETDDSE